MELGANHSGAEPPGRSLPRAQELGASDGGAELGASINGAELRVHFLNSFRHGSICEKLSKKGPNCKKFGRGCRPPPPPSADLWRTSCLVLLCRGEPTKLSTGTLIYLAICIQGGSI